MNPVSKRVQVGQTPVKPGGEFSEAPAMLLLEGSDLLGKKRCHDHGSEKEGPSIFGIRC